MAEERENIEEIANKLEKGEITSKEAEKRLKEQGLMGQASWKWTLFGFITYVLYFILWVPLSLKFSAQLQVISFPMAVTYISLILVAFETFFAVWVTYSHRKKGGLKGSDETVIFYRDGLYGVMRHPGVFGFMMWFIFLPIILSLHIPFTFLTVAGIVLIVISHYYMVYVEEKINVVKWGNEYIQYMKEVPRFNFILGLWRLKKKSGR